MTIGKVRCWVIEHPTSGNNVHV